MGFLLNFNFMNKVPAIFCCLLLMLSFASCKKDDDTTVDLKYDYFPSDSGRYVVYDVDSVTFDGFYDPPVVDTVSFQIKEVVESIFNDNEGRPTMRIERYRRDSTAGNWTILNVWTATRTATVAERVEDNLRFIKLIFPPKADATWRGNAYLQITEPIDYMEDWDYKITAVDVPYTVNGMSFDSSLTVVQHDDENLIEKIYSEEVYATGVGLVYKQMMRLKKDVTAEFPQGSKEGFIYTVRVKEYGVE
jgi:hypothetical protein